MPKPEGVNNGTEWDGKRIGRVLRRYRQSDPTASAAFWRPLFATPKRPAAVADPKPSVVFSAFACCWCGDGLAHEPGDDAWTCAGVLSGYHKATAGHMVRLVADIPPESGSITTRRPGARRSSLAVDL